MDEAIKSYILYNSPLKEKKGKIAFGLLLVLLIGLAIKGWASFVHDGILLTMWEWMSYAITGSVIAYLAIVSLDRKRGIKIFHLITILTVILITAPAASVFNIEGSLEIYLVGFNEEFFKILPLILFAIFIPNLIRTKKDGLLYGALAGVGFNIIEISVYIANTLQQYTILEALYQQSTRFALFGFGSHVIWSAFVGMGIGMAIESKKVGWRKWRIAFIIYIIIAIAHSTYDLGGVGVAMLATIYLLLLIKGETEKFDGLDFTNAGTQNDIIKSSMQVEHFLYNIVFIIIMIWQMIKTLKWEQKILLKQLLTESDEVISESKKNILKNEGVLSMRKYKEYSKKDYKKIVKYQNLLAMLKYSVEKEGKNIDDVKEIAIIRDEIIALK